KIHPVPGLETAHETDHKAAVKVHAPANRTLIVLCPKEAGINRVGKNAHLFGCHSGFFEMAAEGLRNRDHQIRSAPDAAFGPSSKRWEGNAIAVLLLFIGEW